MNRVTQTINMQRLNQDVKVRMIEGCLCVDNRDCLVFYTGNTEDYFLLDCRKICDGLIVISKKGFSTLWYDFEYNPYNLEDIEAYFKIKSLDDGLSETLIGHYHVKQNNLNAHDMITKKVSGKLILTNNFVNYGNSNLNDYMR